MFAIQMYRDPVQRAVCLFLAACIVTSTLASGAIGVLAAERNAAAAFVKNA
jgi:hypothetical protein